MTDAVKLTTLTPEWVEQARQWRETCREGLRTPFLLTQEMQQDFYRRVVSDRDSPHRYFAVVLGEKFLAMTGLTDISPENANAEISLITDPHEQGHGIGSAAVALILEEAFLRLRLETVFGECYECNLAVTFWKKQAERYHALETTRYRRKFWDGKLWDSYEFSFCREAWEKTR